MHLITALAPPSLPLSMQHTSRSSKRNLISTHLFKSNETSVNLTCQHITFLHQSSQRTHTRRTQLGQNSHWSDGPWLPVDQRNFTFHWSAGPVMFVRTSGFTYHRALQYFFVQGIGVELKMLLLIFVLFLLWNARGQRKPFRLCRRLAGNFPHACIGIGQDLGVDWMSLELIPATEQQDSRFRFT